MEKSVKLEVSEGNSHRLLQIFALIKQKLNKEINNIPTILG